jgi:hypothetical protein
MYSKIVCLKLTAHGAVDVDCPVALHRLVGGGELVELAEDVDVDVDVGGGETVVPPSLSL